MPFDKSTILWEDTAEKFFDQISITPLKQQSRHCVSTCLAMLTDEDPEYFQGYINTQNPVSWSDGLKEFKMKLAYCPTDVRRLEFYIEELVELRDLFLLCYYTSTDPSVLLRDPDMDGWICGSHIVILHKNQIYDPMHGYPIYVHDHHLYKMFTKRIFRVVPVDYERGL